MWRIKTLLSNYVQLVTLCYVSHAYYVVSLTVSFHISVLHCFVYYVDNLLWRLVNVNGKCPSLFSRVMFFLKFR